MNDKALVPLDEKLLVMLSLLLDHCDACYFCDFSYGQAEGLRM